MAGGGAAAAGGLSSLMGMASAINDYYTLKGIGKNARRLGKFQKALAESESQALRTQAGQERAVSQRSAYAVRQQMAEIIGRSRAVAAASGAAMSSPSIVANLARLGQQADTRVANVMYTGESRARSLEYGADLTQTEGQMQLENARLMRDQYSDAATNRLVTGLISGGMNAATGPVGEYGEQKFAGMSDYRSGSPVTSATITPTSLMYNKYGQGGFNAQGWNYSSPQYGTWV